MTGLEEETEDDSADFGFAEKEEDRTDLDKQLSNDFPVHLNSQFRQPYQQLSCCTGLISLPPMPLIQVFHNRFLTVHLTTLYFRFLLQRTRIKPTTHLRLPTPFTSAFALLPPSPPIYKGG